MRTGSWCGKLNRSCRAAVAVSFLLCFASSAHAQLLYSYESDLEGWAATGFSGSDLISVAQSTEGPTEGTHSMAVERGNAIGDSNGFSWDVGRSVSAGFAPDAALYNKFLAAAADPTKYALDFDVTLTSQSFANVSNPGVLLSVMASVNSSAAAENNFDQLLGILPVDEDSPNLIGATPKLGTHHYSIPLATTYTTSDSGLFLAQNSTYYQLNIGTNLNNGTFMNGPNGEGLKYYVDNVRIRQLPLRVPETIFSWETPDDPGTTTVNEQFEGWTEGFQAGHTHSLTTTGATDGTSALQIHRVDLDGTPTGDSFTWGSQFRLASDINPGPDVEIDPVIQQRIIDLTAKIEAADRVAFDVTFDPASFDGSPTFAKFGLHFSDTANFYKAEFPYFDILSFSGSTTLTMELPLSAFNAASGDNLAEDGFVDSVPGDYNSNLVVDAADYVVWRNALNTATTLPNEGAGVTPGFVDAADYNLWRANFGGATFLRIGISTNMDGLVIETAPGSGVFLQTPIDFQIDNFRLITEVPMPGSGSVVSAVPEPSSLLLVVSAIAVGLLLGRRGV